MSVEIAWLRATIGVRRIVDAYAGPPVGNHATAARLGPWRPGRTRPAAPLVYDELRRLARIYMRRERAGHTLQATALVNEAYVRLINASEVD
jgi:hypothetical protein